MKKCCLVLLVLLVSYLPAFSQREAGKESDGEKLLGIAHSISSHDLYDVVAELASDKYWGRLTGTEGYDLAARWLVDEFQKIGLEPAGENKTYLQEFDIPYTLVFPGAEVVLHIPHKKSVIKKPYQYMTEFMPGSTSGSGEVTAEVVYVGYGVTAPELGYDDYRGMNVKGKILLMEREVPYWPGDGIEIFKKWYPYSFHQYKLKNAVKHGARGMLYNYGPLANPNNAYHRDFIYCHVGKDVVSDLFTGTGKDHKKILQKIKKSGKPQSFATGKRVTIKIKTEYHPEGRGSNVMAMLPGSDPELKKEVIVIGSHLDHLGRCYEIIPGANDNASAVAIQIILAKALKKLENPLKRSVLFVSFGAEEQGVVGSEYFVDHPTVPLEKIVCLLNMDGVAVGDKLSALGGKNYPSLYGFIDRANNKFVHRKIGISRWENLTRPRLDAAHFEKKGIPLLSFSSHGGDRHYHLPTDNIENIHPEIMEDLAQVLFLAVVEIGNQPHINFREDQAEK